MVISYKIGQKGKRIESHLGRVESTVVEILELENDEHIVFMSVSYTNEGIKTITVKTSKGNLLLAEGDSGDESEEEDSEEEGIMRQDINIHDQGKAVVGFQTKFNDYLEELHVYVDSRTDYDEMECMSPKGKGSRKVSEAGFPTHSNSLNIVPSPTS